MIKARDLFDMAAQRNNARAMDFLAMFYLAGIAVPKSSQREMKLLNASEKDFALALKWYRASAGQNNPLAKYWLGSMYQAGQGVGVDYASAAQLYQESAWMGFAPAQTALGALYRSGNGLPQDTIEAYVWLKLGAERMEQGAIRDLPIVRAGMSEVQIAEGDHRAAAYRTKVKTRS